MKTTVPEMRGLLKGLCLPADIRFGEYLPEYLVRKFDEMHQKLDAMAAENAALKSVLEPKEISDEIQDLFNDTVKLDGDSDGYHEWSWVDNPDEVIMAVMKVMPKPETPATDAYLNSVRADAVVEVSAHLADMAEGKSPHTAELIKSCGRAVFAYAAQLRSGTHDTADKAG